MKYFKNLAVILPKHPYWIQQGELCLAQVSAQLGSNLPANA